MTSSIPGIRLKGTEIKMQLYAIKNEIIDLLTGLRGFKFMATLVSSFEKLKSDDKTMYSNLYLNSKLETVISESDIDGVLESIYSTIF